MKISCWQGQISIYFLKRIDAYNRGMSLCTRVVSQVAERLKKGQEWKFVEHSQNEKFFSTTKRLLKNRNIKLLP